MDSDPDLEIIEKDSGMSSLGGSKDDTPERIAVIEDVDDELQVSNIIATTEPIQLQNDEDNFEDEPDETLTERLWGLTEMFPQSVRNACEFATDFSINSSKSLFKLTCDSSWIFFTSSMILFAPVLLETERAQLVEMEKSQKQRMLLGPGAAMGGEDGVPAMPIMTR